jgi:hypothetical protein
MPRAPPVRPCPSTTIALSTWPTTSRWLSSSNVTTTARPELMPKSCSIATLTMQSKCGTGADAFIEPRNLAVRRFCGDLVPRLRQRINVTPLSMGDQACASVGSSVKNPSALLNPRARRHQGRRANCPASTPPYCGDSGAASVRRAPLLRWENTREIRLSTLRRHSIPVAEWRGRQGRHRMLELREGVRARSIDFVGAVREVGSTQAARCDEVREPAGRFPIVNP